jgi:hypothetical protein
MSRCVQPLRFWYLVSWYASSRRSRLSYHCPNQSAQPASPAAQLRRIVHERQQVRTRAHDAIEVFGHELAHLATAVAGGDCQQENRGVVLVGAPAPADLRRARKHIPRVLRHQIDGVDRVLQRQARLAHIVGSPLRTEYQEPIQLLLRINQVGVAPALLRTCPSSRRVICPGSETLRIRMTIPSQLGGCWENSADASRG